jgi:8-oxo-dGTP pyrophosphatase MutT (NUDIX family)
MKIFLSSTFLDLVEHRKGAVEALERLGQQGVHMEVFGARPEEPMKACIAEIDACEIFIGVYAHRYGFVPPGSNVAITEAEYDHARQAGKAIFCFIVHDEHPWPPRMIEENPGKASLTSFKEKIRRDLVCETFTTPGDLAYKIATSIGRFLVEGPAKEFDQVAAVCYRHAGPSIEFLLILTDGGRWIFPKGNIDQGEQPWQAAKREAHEEAGVLGEVETERLTIFLHQKRGKKRRGIELRVAAFLLRVTATQEPEEPDRHPTWYSPAEAEQAMARDREFKYAEELRRVVRAAVAALAPVA